MSCPHSWYLPWLDFHTGDWLITQFQPVLGPGDDLDAGLIAPRKFTSLLRHGELYVRENVQKQSEGTF